MDDDENIPEFQLKSIQDITDVNRLAPNQKIDFNSNMTVIFGENATGKSGYTRILKTIADARSVEHVLPNVYQPQQNVPAATIVYSVAGKRHLVPLDQPERLRSFSTPNNIRYDCRAVPFVIRTIIFIYP